MLTGTRAFAGEDVSDTLGGGRRSASRTGTPLAARRARPRASGAARCACRKIRGSASQDIGDVRLALEGAFETTAPQTTSAATSSAPRGRLAWMAALAVAAVVIVALAIPAVRHLRETPPPAPPETRIEIVTPATDQPMSFALSPDGRQIVFVASGDGASRLWLRSLATTTAQPLAGTEGATLSLLVARQPVRRLLRRGCAEAARPRRRRPADPGAGHRRYGGTWNADGVIVFAPS